MQTQIFLKMYWELSDAELKELYETGQEQGVLELVGYDVQLNQDLFNIFARRVEVFCGVYGPAKTPLGFFYLNNFEGQSARIHFCLYRAGRERQQEIGGQVIEWCFKTFEFKSLIGIVPVINQGAADFARKVGGREIAMVPGRCWIERLKRTVGGMVFMFLPSNVEGDEEEN